MEKLNSEVGKFFIFATIKFSSLLKNENSYGFENLISINDTKKFIAKYFIRILSVEIIIKVC